MAESRSWNRSVLLYWIVYTWLQYLFPFYIWFTVGLIILCCRHSTTFSRMFGSNPVAEMYRVKYCKGFSSKSCYDFVQMNRHLYYSLHCTLQVFPHKYILNQRAYESIRAWEEGNFYFTIIHTSDFLTGSFIVVVYKCLSWKKYHCISLMPSLFNLGHSVHQELHFDKR